MPHRVAVTGATGFIGGALCARLIAEGHEVRALVRHPQKAGRLPAGVFPVTGDVTRPGILPEFIDGCDAVMHCAGSVRGASQTQFDRVNVDGLRHLLGAMKNARPAPKLLSLSSLAAREPGLSFYAASKYRGELVLLEQGEGLVWTVLRPPAVYGPGDTELLPLLKMMTRGFALIPGSPRARFSMIYIDDLVSAMLAWLHHPQAANGIFTLDDGTEGGYDWLALMQAASSFSGRPVRRLPVPAGMLDLIARLNRSAARLFGYAPMLTPEKLRELRHADWVCDSTALQQALDWQPRTRLPEGLKRTMIN